MRQPPSSVHVRNAALAWPRASSWLKAMTAAGYHSAAFRFYAELNDFLSEDRRGRAISHRFLGRPAVKDAIEALGIPHVEVDLILVNGQSVGFAHRLENGDRVSVYPVFESLGIEPLVRLQGRPLRTAAFLTDVHLGALTRWLRLLGFDTMSAPCPDDPTLAQIAADTGRILLTRDRELLKRRSVTRGYWIRSTRPLYQAREVVRRFDLAGAAKPFHRCPSCNGHLAAVDRNAVLERIPPRTARWLDAYVQCDDCGKLFWRGTHHPRLKRSIEWILDTPPDGRDCAIPEEGDEGIR